MSEPSGALNAHPLSPMNGSTTDTEIASSSLFQLTDDQRAMCPRAGERDVYVIAARRGLEAAFAARPRPAIGRHPIPEDSLRANEVASRTAPKVVTSPSAIDQHSHLKLLASVSLTFR